MQCMSFFLIPKEICLIKMYLSKRCIFLLRKIDVLIKQPLSPSAPRTRDTLVKREEGIDDS